MLFFSWLLFTCHCKVRYYCYHYCRFVGSLVFVSTIFSLFTLSVHLVFWFFFFNSLVTRHAIFFSCLVFVYNFHVVKMKEQKGKNKVSNKKKKKRRRNVKTMNVLFLGGTVYVNLFQMTNRMCF